MASLTLVLSCSLMGTVVPNTFAALPVSPVTRPKSRIGAVSGLPLRRVTVGVDPGESLVTVPIWMLGTAPVGPTALYPVSTHALVLGSQTIQLPVVGST